jgi:DNA uptake protein ComE-like DNA-binding protein
MRSGSTIIFFTCTALIMLFCNLQFKAKAQTPIDTSNNNKQEEIDQRIEDIATSTDAELDYSDLLDQLKQFEDHPLNLNTATAEELRQLIFLNDIQINNLLEHIRRNGKLMAIYELQTIEGFSLDVIYKILPYVYVSGDVNKRHFSVKEIFAYGNNILIMRYGQVLEQEVGFSPITDSALAANPNSRYLGSPEKLYLKYRFTYYNNISWGLTAEKDAGEEFFKGSQKNGFDFYSAHFCIRNMGVVKALAIGDYQVQFGQGLTLWSGLGFGKSSDATGIKKNAQGILPFTSVDENKFMRGIGTTIGNKHFDLSLFYSSHKVDGNVAAIDTLNNEAALISALQETGYHTIPSEMADKHSVAETIYGGHFTYSNRHLILGATGYKTVFGTELNRNLQLYSQYQFEGKENSNLGVDYSYIFKNFNFFGEVGRSENGAMAYLNGMLLSLDPRFSISVLHRNYAKDYQDLLSTAFAENSTIANEKALYIGFVAKPHRFWTLTAYLDNFHFPWMTYLADAPSRGYDGLAQINFKPSKKVEMYFRYRQQNKQVTNTSPDNMINFLDNSIKQNFRFNIVYPVSQSFSLKNRVEFMNYQLPGNITYHGYLMYQDINYKKMRSPLSFSFRYAIFDSDSYSAALYAFEDDVLYSSSFPSYYYKGSRAYLVLHYKLNRHFDFWFRYAETYYSNKSVISSGLTQINGNVKSDIKGELILKF